MHSKVLIVEDDQAISQMYRFKFESAGFDVKVAENGAIGLALAESFLPDILLVDLRMPVMTGDAMLTTLRAQEWSANMRAIILTNISKNEAPHTLRFLRVDRYIVKAHSTPSQVLDVVKEVLAD